MTNAGYVFPGDAPPGVVYENPLLFREPTPVAAARINAGMRERGVPTTFERSVRDRVGLVPELGMSLAFSAGSFDLWAATAFLRAPDGREYVAFALDRYYFETFRRVGDMVGRERVFDDCVNVSDAMGRDYVVTSVFRGREVREYYVARHVLNLIDGIVMSYAELGPWWACMMRCALLHWYYGLVAEENKIIKDWSTGALQWVTRTGRAIKIYGLITMLFWDFPIPKATSGVTGLKAEYILSVVQLYCVNPGRSDREMTADECRAQVDFFQAEVDRHYAEFERGENHTPADVPLLAS